MENELADEQLDDEFIHLSTAENDNDLFVSSDIFNFGSVNYFNKV
jgi:hypothetical protein